MWRRTRNKWLVLLLHLGCAISIVGLAPPVRATDTAIEANVCSDFGAPTIVEPAPHTTDNTSITVIGSGEPDMTVAIRDNGDTVGVSTIAPDGSYSLQVPLFVGDNILIARTANECQGKDSSPVTVHRNAPPQPVPAPPIPPEVPPEEPVNPASPKVVPRGPGDPSQPSIGQPLPAPLPPPSPGYEKPIITEPRNGETLLSGNVTVAGTASPLSVISVYVNGVVVATVVANEEGKFRVGVMLEPGENTLQVRSAAGGKAAFSDRITVTYTDLSNNDTQERQYVWLIIVLTILLCLLVVLMFYIRRRQKGQKL